MTAAVPPDGARLKSPIVRRLSWSATLVIGSMAYATPAKAGAFATARYTAEHGHPTTDNATALYFNPGALTDRKSTRLNSSHSQISYAVFCLTKKTTRR